MASNLQCAVAMDSTPYRGRAAPLLAALVLAASAACATNPATGERQLALVGTEREIELGREADQQIVQQMGLYPDEDLQDYVAAVGRRLAASSERPELPWTFRVLDDPVVNAFALPGGFVYLTRGILAHFGSEAEMAAVLGHEIGHVTARHGVEQMSRAQLATLGLGIGMILSPELRDYGSLAQTGLQLLFLKYGRADERQADDLGLRYVVRESYDPREMASVFQTLERVSRAQGQGRLPNWLSSHPAPEARAERVQQAVAELPPGDARVGREELLAQLDGVVFGEDPRDGFFRGNTFYHPRMAFQVTFPTGWKASNQRQAVGAVSPEEDAVVVLSLAERGTPRDAAREFFAQSGVRQGDAWRGELGGTTAVAAQFLVAREQSDDIQGVAAFVARGERVFQILGFSTEPRWSRYSAATTGAIESFGPVTDRAVLDVEPRRIDLVTLRSGMTLREFERRHPSTVDLQTLALINQVEPDEPLAAGRKVKRVVGGPG